LFGTELTGSVCSGIEKAQAEPTVWEAPNINTLDLGVTSLKTVAGP